MALHQWNKNIKILRLQHGLSQAQLGIKMSTTSQTISNWETGMSAPDFAQLMLLTNILGVSTDTFFNDTHLNEKSQSSKNKLNPHLNPHGNTHLNHQNDDQNNILREPESTYINKNDQIIKMQKELDLKDKLIMAQEITIKSLQSALSHAESRIEDPNRSKRKAG